MLNVYRVTFSLILLSASIQSAFSTVSVGLPWGIVYGLCCLCLATMSACIYRCESGKESTEESTAPQEKKKASAMGLIPLALMAAAALSFVLAVVYFGTWLFLGFGIGLYFFFMTYLDDVRISTTAGSTVFNAGLVILPLLQHVLFVLLEFKENIGEQALNFASKTPIADLSARGNRSLFLAQRVGEVAAVSSTTREQGHVRTINPIARVPGIDAMYANSCEAGRRAPANVSSIDGAEQASSDGIHAIAKLSPDGASV